MRDSIDERRELAQRETEREEEEEESYKFPNCFILMTEEKRGT
jgi:hypothetical protein